LPLKGTNHSSEQKERIRTETGTFRIDQDILNELRSEAKQKHESLNVVINNVLEFYVNYYVPLRKARYIHFSIDLLARIFNNLNDEQIHKIAEEYVKYEFKEQIRMVGLEDTISSYIEGLCRWLEMSGFPYRHDESNNADIYTIRFDMGTRYSIFFGKYIQAIAEHFKVKDLEAEVTNNTVMFKIQRT
jgi:hypothetical protein